MHRGYIKLYRKALDSGMLQNPELWTFWSWCLLKASHKPAKQMLGFQVIELEAGQLLFGRKVACKELNLSEWIIRSCMTSLREMGNITVKTTNKFSVITIMNWNTYQREPAEVHQQNHQLEHQQTTNNPPTDHHKQEVKELKNEKNLKTSSAHSGSSKRDYPEDFNTAWKNHGRQDGSKWNALKKWEGLKKAGSLPPLEQITAAQNSQKKSKAWMEGFIPHFETWLNGRMWEAEVNEQAPESRPATASHFDSLPPDAQSHFIAEAKRQKPEWVNLPGPIRAIAEKLADTLAMPKKPSTNEAN